MSILEIDNPEAPTLVLGPGLAGTLMSPDEFDEASQVDDNFKWIIDRFDRTMTACRCDGPDVVIPHDGIYRTPLLPGFELPLARLLEVADRWQASKED